MGCDIHMFIEYKKNGKWQADKCHVVEVYDSDYFNVEEAADGGRNYVFFGALAGVRSAAVHPLFEPRNIPSNLSENVQKAVDIYGVDGHTHSYLSLDEFKQVIDHYNKTIDTNYPYESDRKIKDDDGYYQLYLYCLNQVERSQADAVLLDNPDLAIQECRIVFFFDN